MRISNGTLVLVTDGRKMLLFRNGGDADYPKFERIEQAEDDNPPDHEIKTDRAGRTAFFGTERQSAYGECDFHRQEEAHFVRQAGEMLSRRAERGEFDRIVVVADPRTLGELRKHYGTTLGRRVVGEVAKDLVKHPVAEIERILSES